MVRGRLPEKGSINRGKTIDFTEVEDVPYTSQRNKPKMPKYYQRWLEGELCDIPVPQEAKLWWQTVSTMPHCILWTPSDWQFFKTSFFLACMCLSGDAKSFGELRQREAKMGVTAADRLALRIRYVEPKQKSQSTDVDSGNVVSSRAARAALLIDLD